MTDHDDELCYKTARELSALLRGRELSAREVVRAHLERIERVNPDVNAIVTLVADRALDAAAAADERIVAAGADGVGVLHGLPIAHKDTHNTAGIRTSHGSPLVDGVPDQDDLIIERIRDAGAITLGKTNVPEFAAGSHTFNPIFGATHNPYALDRSAGGSSGGAAAALASGMVPIADGSDTGGSLRNPASFNNVVGLRPSPGRVPTWPAANAWTTLSVKGPMARTVADTALLLSAMAGPDPRSPIALEEPGARFARPLDRDLTGLRVAWSPDLGGLVPVEPEVAAVVEASAGVFEDLGCVVERACPDLSEGEEVFRTQRAALFEVAFGPLMDRHPEGLKRTIRENAEAGRRLTGPEVARAEVLHTALFHRVRAFFERYDVLLLPVSQVPPFDIGIEYPTEVAGVAMGDYLEWMRSAYLVTSTGSPALSVPAGFTPAGLPVGLQIVGPHRADFAVLQIGHAFEQATGYGRRRPESTGAIG
ncbi:amidase [Streptomyces sp. Rer75]|uniref:amidase n=1 Tax=Streptomyces sp. Rer75 TaxID=2750011 RepID=UPI0015CFF12B|nr:amidase [Streptomyces sp. Rer75]QLH22770.1 amidase [Streptomyces sp. Rer75]